jgi:hypothetical protein
MLASSQTQRCEFTPGWPLALGIVLLLLLLLTHAVCSLTGMVRCQMLVLSPIAAGPASCAQTRASCMLRMSLKQSIGGGPRCRPC